MPGSCVIQRERAAALTPMDLMQHKTWTHSSNYSNVLQRCGHWNISIFTTHKGEEKK